MKYLCLVTVDEKRLQAMSESEAQALDDESLEYDDALRKGGHSLLEFLLQFLDAGALKVSCQNAQGVGES
jgi:hypothetical protein